MKYLTLILSLLLWTTTGLCQSDWNATNWEAACLKGLAKQEATYNAFRATFQKREAGLRQGNEIRYDCVVHVLSPDMLMYEKTMTEVRTNAAAEFLKRTSYLASARNPSYAFSVKKSATTQYLLEALSTTSPTEERLTAEIDGFTAAPLYSFLFSGVRLSLLIQEKHFRALEVRTKAVDGKDICEIRFEISAEAAIQDGIRKRRPGKSIGVIQFLPKQDWAIAGVEYQFIGNDRFNPGKTYTNTISIKNRYSQIGDASLLNWSQVGIDSGYGVDSVNTYENISYSFEKPTPDQFLLFHFQLPEPTPQKPNSAAPTQASVPNTSQGYRSIWLLIGAGILVTIVGCIYLLKFIRKAS
ncbi:MAG: hypothetical protein ACRC8S_08060 [Fimbriiglobus sp.]